MTTPTLNKGQQAAADGFFDFLFSDKRELIIAGPGGVGKTYLMGYLIDKVMKQYHDSCSMLGIDPLYDTVTMTATTNKAAEVLGIATKRPTSTIHSFLGLRVQDDFETGESHLARGKLWQVHHNVIIFVDECSMIDRMLLKQIRESTQQCKVIYVGDHCQLAPVKETLSPIYKENLPFYELTEPMRNAEQPALMEICDQLRQTVKTGVFRPIRVVPGIIDLVDDTRMEEEIHAHFMDPSNRDRILAYTNQRVIEFNSYIRSMKGLPETFTDGEHVISNTAMQPPGYSIMMAVEDEFCLKDVDEQVSEVVIDKDTSIDVIYATLEGKHNTFKDVKIPVNREHIIALQKYYASKKDWSKYFNLKNNFPDLRPRDAATVHKAQGSTYDTVFIDMDDLSTCRDSAMAARLLYVAFTRARKRVVMYGKLARKFGGVIG